MLIQEDCLIKKEKIYSKEFLNNPGTTYLRVLQFYQEEKKWNMRRLNTLENWEKFISQYFSENTEINIKYYDKDEVSYEISNNNLFN